MELDNRDCAHVAVGQPSRHACTSGATDGVVHPLETIDQGEPADRVAVRTSDRRARAMFGTRSVVMAGAVLLLATTVTACSGGSTATTSQGSPATSANGPSAPSVTAKEIRVGAIATRTGLGAGDFAAFVPGMQ